MSVALFLPPPLALRPGGSLKLQNVGAIVPEHLPGGLAKERAAKHPVNSLGHPGRENSVDEHQTLVAVCSDYYRNVRRN